MAMAAAAAAAGGLLWALVVRGAFGAAWWAAPALLPLGMLVYAYLHELFHVRRRGALVDEAAALVAASSLGLSWKIYVGHHANHHRHDNGRGDFSTTIGRDGRTMPGWQYAARRALWPFFVQCVPFASYLGMRRENRTAAARVDELVRVGMRAGVLALGGPRALGFLLLWQGTFALFIMYVNYLQHWRAPVGGGESWNDPLFNAIFVGFALHDGHHRRSPAPAVAPRRIGAAFHLFNPSLFGAFLLSPRLLAALANLTFGELPR